MASSCCSQDKEKEEKGLCVEWVQRPHPPFAMSRASTSSARTVLWGASTTRSSRDAEKDHPDFVQPAHGARALRQAQCERSGVSRSELRQREVSRPAMPRIACCTTARSWLAVGGERHGSPPGRSGAGKRIGGENGCGFTAPTHTSKSHPDHVRPHPLPPSQPAPRLAEGCDATASTLREDAAGQAGSRSACQTLSHSRRPMTHISLKHKPPSHGWLSLALRVGDQVVEIDASDVPNNPVQDLLAAVEGAALGCPASVWLNLEPDGYFMHFTPVGAEVEFKLEYATRSQPSLARLVLSGSGSRSEVLLPFWRFLRDFQSRSYPEPHWPRVDFGRIGAIKRHIAPENEAAQETPDD
jgi:hypothetical protein